MADSSVNTGAAGAPIRVLTALGAGVADQQVVTLADSAGNLLGTTAAPLPIARGDTTATGNLTATGSVTVATTGGNGIVGVQITGTWSATVVFEATTDGTTFFSASGMSSVTGTQANGVAVSGQWRINSGGFTAVRARVSAFTSGTVVITLVASSASTMATLAEPLPTGTNTIGAITGSGTAGTPATGVQTIQGISGGSPVNTNPTSLVISTTAAISTAVTATLPAAGAGLFHYITGIEIQRYAGAALTGAAAPVVVTTTNLPGSLAWSFDTAGAIGTSQIQLLSFAGNPFKSTTANTATTIVAPLTTSVIWRINVTYYTGL